MRRFKTHCRTAKNDLPTDRQTANGAKAGRLSSHPLLLGSRLEELAAAVAGSPLEGGDGGSPAMVTVHDGRQRGEEGRRPEVRLHAAVLVAARVVVVVVVDARHLGAGQAGDAAPGVAARVAAVVALAELRHPWRLGARRRGEARRWRR